MPRRPKGPKKYTPRSKVTSQSVRDSSWFGKEANDLNQAYLMQAAEIIAVQARANAGKFSKRIGPATHVAPGDVIDEAIVITNGDEAPNAAPFEYAKRHPFFGSWETPDRTHKQPRRPYMAKAFRAKADAAMEEYSRYLPYLTDRAGYDDKTTEL